MFSNADLISLGLLEQNLNSERRFPMRHFKDLTVDEIQDFVNSVNEALRESKINPVYSFNDRGFPVSFDKDLYAFVASSRSFNTDDGRAYLRDDTRLIRRITPLLRQLPARIAGGRVFIGKRGVVKRDATGNDVLICKWDWPY